MAKDGRRRTNDEGLLRAANDEYWNIDYDPVTSDTLLESGQVAITIGWAGDVLRVRDKNSAVSYILPDEGTILWGDNWMIPANSPRRYAAELLINFLLRPEISAQIANYNYYATANEAARPLIKPEILDDTVIFPPEAALKKAEILMALSPEGQKLYDDVWERFTAAQ